MSNKFNVKKLEKLNNPERLKMINIEGIVNHYNLKNLSTIVDLGTGTGIFAKKILELIPNAECIGLDISPEMIDFANENIATIEKRYSAQLMEENHIPLEDNSVELLFMITVYHELDNPQSILKEIFRVLKPGGRVFILDWKPGANVKHADQLVTTEEVIRHLSNSCFTDIEEYNASEKLYCISSLKL